MAYRTWMIFLSIGICLSYGTPPVLSQVPGESILTSINKLSAEQRTARLLSGAREERLVEWYGSLPFTDVRPLIKKFKKLYPFIEVKYTRGGGTSLVNRVLTEHRAGVNKVDVLGGRGNLHTTLMKAGLVAKNMAPLRREIRKGFMDERGYLVAPFTYAVVIGYNTHNVRPDKIPQSYHDLLGPEWKGQMALDREAYDWFAGMLDILGEERGVDFARKIAAQNLTLRRGHTLMTQLMAAGDIKIMVDGYHFRLQSFKEKGAPVDYVLTNPTILKEPSALWIMKHASHPHASALLVDFLFSLEAQEIYASQNRLVARKDMEWDFKGKKLPDFHVLSSEKWGPRYNDLIRQFDQIFRRGN